MTPHSRRRRRRHRPTVRSVARAGVFATSFVSLSSIMVGAAAAPVGPVDVGAWSDPVTDDALASLPVSPGIPPPREAREASGIEVPTRSGSIEDAIAHRARPVIVTIPSLGVTAPVGAASVEPLSGQLALPPDAASVVWYRHGPSPGQEGSAVLAGHVDWNGRRGAFFALDTLPPGAEISIGYDDDTTRRFVVQVRRSYPKPELPVQELFAPTGEPKLTLVTCGGSFDRVTRHYRDNVVVVATPVT